MYKKIVCLIMASVLLFASGCGVSQIENDTASETAKETEAAQNELADETSHNTETLQNGWTSDLVKLNVEKYSEEMKDTCEINKKKYDISIVHNGEDYYNVKINGVSTDYKIGWENIFYAAAAELNGSDLVLFVGYGGETAWQYITAVRYSEKGIDRLVFGKDVDGKDETICGAGSSEFDIEVYLESGSDFKSWQHTSSTGMWNILKTYTIRGNEIITHEQSCYETNTKQFLSIWEDDVKGEERKRLLDGYVMSHKSYDILEEGKYFTMLYDDGHDQVYVKTEDGKEGWINVLASDWCTTDDGEKKWVYICESGADISRYLFFLAS